MYYTDPGLDPIVWIMSNGRPSKHCRPEGPAILPAAVAYFLVSCDNRAAASLSVRDEALMTMPWMCVKALCILCANGNTPGIRFVARCTAETCVFFCCALETASTQARTAKKNNVF